MFKNIPQEVIDIITKIEDNGYEAYMVGGCVRDLIMGNTPDDYDICSSALPEQTMEIFKGEGMVTAGLKHGTVGIIRKKNVYEITTYRLDGEYTDGRHPDSVAFTDKLGEDLLRRDFTINAMAYNPKTGIVDMYGGREDIEKGIIKCVGNPEERFSEDALRILRAVRFAARFGFCVEDATKSAMHKLYPTIEKVSAERVTTEFVKTLQTKNASEYVNEFREIIAYFIPEIKAMFEFDQKSVWHSFDLWEHTIKALSYADGDVYVRMAAFLHDIAKPLVFTTDEDGHRHFATHEQEGAKMAKKILKRLKCSNDVIDNVSLLISVHDFTLVDSKKSVKKLLNKLGEENFDRLMRLRKADIMAHKEDADENALQLLAKMCELKEKIVSVGECFDIKSLAISGNDLKEMGIKPGPEFGRILNVLLEEVISENVDNTNEALKEYIKMNFI